MTRSQDPPSRTDLGDVPPAPSAHDDSGPAAGLGRRSLLLAGLGTLVGCASPTTRRALPGALWPESTPIARQGTPVPTPVKAAPALPGVMARYDWTRSSPVGSRVNPMTKLRFITVHHDGMSPFYATSKAAVAARIELIRAGHVNRRGWGDIGYHFTIDRAGRIWEARSLGLQGAHVKDHNEGNIGVLCLGNFEEQVPSTAQVRALESFVKTLHARYGITRGGVKTHQDWAPTKCPGKHLLPHTTRVIASL